MTRPESTVAVAGAAIAVLAVLELPYGLYTFIRLALTGAAITLIVFSVRRESYGWLWGLIPIALLWNPLIPVYLTRGAWLPLDLGAAAFLIVFAINTSKAAPTERTRPQP